MLVLVLCFALGVAMILYAVNSERGTRYVWQAATSLLNARLSGTLDGGGKTWEPIIGGLEGPAGRLGGAVDDAS